MIRAEIGLKNRQIINETYSFRVINTFCEKMITLDFVSGDNFFPRVLIYPNTFIQGQYVYIVENTPKIAPKYGFRYFLIL
jgi:hypothetical protein